MVKIFHAEAMNPVKRNTMEDAFVVHKPGEWGSSRYTFIGVYDGHGGREMVDFLKHGLSFHIAEELEADDGQIFMQIARAFLAADVHAKMVGINTSGSTVAICLIQETETMSTVITANVGDARICLYRGKQVLRMTKDHCPNLPSEKDRIQSTEGGFIVRGRVCGILAISRSLGDQALKEFVTAKPCVHQQTAERDGSSFIIIACDGFWDVLSDTQAGLLVLEYVGTSEEKKATVVDHLLNKAIQLGTTDNVTVVVAWL